jgi:hypothetical protein
MHLVELVERAVRVVAMTCCWVSSRRGALDSMAQSRHGGRALRGGRRSKRWPRRSHDASCPKARQQRTDRSGLRRREARRGSRARAPTCLLSRRAIRICLAFGGRSVAGRQNTPKPRPERNPRSFRRYRHLVRLDHGASAGARPQRPQGRAREHATARGARRAISLAAADGPGSDLSTCTTCRRRRLLGDL